MLNGSIEFLNHISAAQFSTETEEEADTNLDPRLYERVEEIMNS
jgi:hypothetical protein